MTPNSKKASWDVFQIQLNFQELFENMVNEVINNIELLQKLQTLSLNRHY